MTEIYSFCSKSSRKKPEVEVKKSFKPNANSFVQTGNAKKYKKVSLNVKSETKEKPVKIERKRISIKDHNIFNIDSIIKKELTDEIDNINNLYNELDNILNIYNEGSSKDRVIAKNRISYIRNKIKNIENSSMLSYYLFRTSSILENYRKISLTESSRSFVNPNSKTNSKLKQTSDKKAELISKFISIAKDYIEIDDYQQSISKLSCPECGSSDMRRVSDENTTFVCSMCYTEVNVLDDTPSFKDTDRINMCSRYTYSRKGHFIDSIKKHQGKQNTDANIIDKVVKTLKEEMVLHNLTVDNVKKQHLYMFLSERDLSSHYDDLNLIYHIITGVPCPDISQYEQRLLEDFDEQEGALDQVYEMDTQDTRVNSLNVYYKLYKLLQRCGCRCRKDDFYILKTKAKEDEHDEKMEKAWKILGWKWIDTF